MFNNNVSFARTNSGLKNYSSFLKNYYIVIVEGADDCIFWRDFFPKINGYEPKFKIAGGKNEIKKCLEPLVLSNAKFIIAMDSDYSFIQGISYDHINRVLETQAHSIENLMLCSSNITRFIQDLSKTTEYDPIEVKAWLQHFDEMIYLFMVADYTIEYSVIDKKKCMPDNCERFFIKDDMKFSEDEINKFISSLGLSEEDFYMNIHKLQEYQPSLHARGHFFFSAVYHFVINKVKCITEKKPKLSTESFYSMSIQSCHWCLEESPILKKLKEKANTAAYELVQLLESSSK